MSALADQLELAATNLEWSNPQPAPVDQLLRQAAKRLRELEARVDSLEAAQATGRTNYVPRTSAASPSTPPPNPRKK